MGILQITKSVYDEMVGHAQRQMPLEACGYLAGITATPSRPSGDSPLDPVMAKTFIPMTNIDKSPEHFTFDPKEQFAAIKQVRQSGESLLAVYHSHPETPARLSAEDVRLFNDPNMIYVIVSLAAATPEVNAYTVRKHEDIVEISRVDIVVS